MEGMGTWHKNSQYSKPQWGCWYNTLWRPYGVDFITETCDPAFLPYPMANTFYTEHCGKILLEIPPLHKRIFHILLVQQLCLNWDDKFLNQTTEMCEEVMNHEGNHKVSMLSVNKLQYCCLSFTIPSTSTHRVTNQPTPASDWFANANKRGERTMANGGRFDLKLRQQDDMGVIISEDHYNEFDIALCLRILHAYHMLCN